TDLVNRMVDTLVEKWGDKYKVTQREASWIGKVTGQHDKKLNELIGKELKNILGEYKSELDALPQAAKDKITAATKKSAVNHFKAFRTSGIAQMVKDYIHDNQVVLVKSDGFKAAIGSNRDAVLATSLTTASSTASESVEDIARSIRDTGGARVDVRLDRSKTPYVIHLRNAIHGPTLLKQALSDNFTVSEYSLEKGPVSQDAVIVHSYTRDGIREYVVEAKPQGWKAVHDGVSSSTVSAPEKTGGINLNPALINLQIRRDPNGVPLPVSEQPIANIKIRGFLPVIIKVSPVDLSELIEFDNTVKDQVASKRSWN
ncbi:MAG: hypothetical protein KJ977_04025, partial [Candidatus Omnitrophica bacterium]|nr:hypothetical protein [Candidatus Omnitrophota bacterium]